MTPFSGPIQRSCESLTRWRQVWPQLETSESRVRPRMRSARCEMAEHTISLPRPIVKVWVGVLGGGFERETVIKNQD
jgi:hypothetical protein